MAGTAISGAISNHDRYICCD
ncbi:unnamed protein product [Fusarium venenatum]|uniref:Uncharacterized protein n=1 Tax=Fusarium venenatum TaxID=56646 RepID=A0A2L2TF47_9HYPO|nr:unnamed protein product [Fusarium venenatum]